MSSGEDGAKRRLHNIGVRRQQKMKCRQQMRRRDSVKWRIISIRKEPPLRRRRKEEAVVIEDVADAN
jgi:hypothetical protein